MSGMLRFGRKQCAGCGNECLETDPRCWACGGWQFGPAPEEITLDLPGPHEAIIAEPTLGWETSPHAPTRWRVPAAVVGGLAVALLLGFLIGRHSARSEEAVNAADPPRVYTTHALPPPPAAAPRAGEPEIEIRPLGPPRRQTRRNGTAASPQPIDPFPSLPSPPAPSPGARPARPETPPLAASQPTPAPAATPPPPPEPPVDPKEARVALRNNAPIAVELRFEGFNGTPDGSIMMSPGSAFEVSMAAGDYRVQVGARGAESDSAKAVFVGKRRYGFVIDAARGQAGTPIALRLREPEVDGER